VPLQRKGTILVCVCTYNTYIIIIISFYPTSAHCSACLHCIYYYCGGGSLQKSVLSGAASTRVFYYSIISPLLRRICIIILFPYNIHYIFIPSIKIWLPISEIVAVNILCNMCIDLINIQYYIEFSRKICRLSVFFDNFHSTLSYSDRSWEGYEGMSSHHLL